MKDNLKISKESILATASWIILKVTGTERKRERGEVQKPDYSLETSRAGFVFRGGRLYNSVSRSLREKISSSKFKQGAKKWMGEQIPVRPGR